LSKLTFITPYVSGMVKGQIEVSMKGLFKTLNIKWSSFHLKEIAESLITNLDYSKKGVADKRGITPVENQGICFIICF